jgi:hypothetical protein
LRPTVPPRERYYILRPPKAIHARASVGARPPLRPCPPQATGAATRRPPGPPPPAAATGRGVGGPVRRRAPLRHSGPARFAPRPGRLRDCPSAAPDAPALREPPPPLPPPGLRPVGGRWLGFAARLAVGTDAATRRRSARALTRTSTISPTPRPSPNNLAAAAALGVGEACGPLPLVALPSYSGAARPLAPRLIIWPPPPPWGSGRPAVRSRWSPSPPIVGRPEPLISGGPPRPHICKMQSKIAIHTLQS